jgi:ubiquinone/menaquinone biosynthesis C-methylase UbiE
MDAEEAQACPFIDRFNAVASSYDRSSGGCTRELARALLSLPQLSQAGEPGSIVLDNSCGTGIVTEEIMQRHRHVEGSERRPATIHTVDPASNMVAIARRKLEVLADGPSRKGAFKVTAHVMRGEELAFDGNTFTHIITNLGILFYEDSLVGAKEMYRTLMPGGVAVVTSWIDLGYFEQVLQPAHSEIRLDDPPLELPLSLDWLSPSHLKTTMVRAGFQEVQISTSRVHHGARTLEKLVDSLMETFHSVWAGWTDDERIKFRGFVREMATPLAERYTMPDGNPGFGIPMVAAVAVCRKY